MKEIGNSIYGKIAQGVASTRIIKDDIEQRHVFNTMFGVTDQMGPSAITNAMMAAYCTGLVRALLTGDADAAAGRDVGRDGDHRRLADRRRADGYRPERTGSAAFRAVRERITPGDDTIWEVKHLIPERS